MAGRPPLRIGQHGKITRKNLGGGVWLAKCRYRDSDGVTRIVERRGPADDFDKHGKLAEDALIEALHRRPPGVAYEISLDTKVMDLVGRHIDRLTEDGRAIRTIDTYRDVAGRLNKFISGVRVGDATAPLVDAALRSMRRAHGPTMATQAKTILNGGLQLAVLASVLGSNPVRDVSAIRFDDEPEGAVALTADELRDLLNRLRADEYCRKSDLVDPLTIFMATGLRRSELLGLLWSDFDEEAGTLTVTGKLVQAKGTGLQRIAKTKSKAGKRTIPLPRFAIAALATRRKLPFLGEQKMIFPSTVGTYRDPDTFGGQWRKAREALGVPEVTTTRSAKPSRR